MSREIKFRGLRKHSLKSIDKSRWIYGYYNFEPKTGIAEIIYNDAGLTVHNETIGQFTGLTDKNGKEIFEGDLLKGKSNCIYKVYWDEKLCAFHTVGNDGDKYGAYTLSLSTNTGFQKDKFEKDIEIIGNIYENPDLLK